jgi:hypothetical protein
MGKGKIVIFFLVCVAWSGAGCRHDYTGVTFNKRVSINIATPDRDWPGDPAKSLTSAQRQVFEARGRPTYVRFWWQGRDDYSTLMEVEQSNVNIYSVPTSWIYMREGDEVLFPSIADYESRPIDDRLKRVLQDGDPFERRFDPGAAGEDVEIWHYLSTGYEYRFINGQLIDQKRLHEPVGSGRSAILLR